jgi:hypothetical protein
MSAIACRHKPNHDVNPLMRRLFDFETGNPIRCAELNNPAKGEKSSSR